MRAGARRRHKSASASGATGSSHAFWGDRKGLLAFRRYLLNPALLHFGAARQQDTCVLWTGRSPQEAAGRDDIDAVCFPPTGFVPIHLLQNGSMPWTVMPDTSRFQPTAETRIQVFQVRISPEKVGVERTAERLREVPVSGLAIDCSTRGEPFCVIFYPELLAIHDGLQLEVVLSGLRGEVSEMVFFHELRSLRQRIMDQELVTEAATIREVLGNSLLWEGCRDGTKICAKEIASEVSGDATEGVGTNEAFKRSNEKGDAVAVELVSHPGGNIVSDSVDLTIVLRSPEASSMRASLHLLRFSGDEEVPRAVQVMKLRDRFFVRTKLPFARSRYELRFYASSMQEPAVLTKHPLKYTINTTETCQTLLASFADPLVHKFGLCQMARIAQLDGAFIITPATHRITTGLCYFLVYMDVRAVETVARRDQSSASAAYGEDGIDSGPPQTSLLRRRQSQKGSTALAEVQGQVLNALVQKDNVQNTIGQIHLDISVRDVKTQLRLTQRSDFPELHEGLMAFEPQDEATSVQLFLRFPQLHAANFSPRKLAEWVVCRDEQFPISF